MLNLTNGENTALGCVTAAVVAVTLQPTLYYKNMIQQQLPWKLLTPPRDLYRGLAAATLAQVGELGLQFLLTGVVKKAIVGDRPEEQGMSNNEVMGAALLGGALSALYTSPAELCMVQQQNFGGSLPSTLKRIVQTSGVLGLSRGLVAAALRDGTWTLGLLGFTPIIQEYLMRKHQMSLSGSGFAASLAAGTVVGVLSCPFDVIKTSLQGDLHGKVFKSTLSTAVLQRKRLLSGVQWRVANVIGTIMIANEFRTRVAPLMFPSKF